MFSAAQRLALLALGRSVDSAGEPEKLQARKGLNNAQSPTCRLHAVLACLVT